MAEVMAWPLNLAEYAYNAEDVQRWMAGKTSGVYGAEGNWQVAAAGGMNLTVKATDQLGGWLSNMGRYGVVFWNGADIQLTVPTADGTLPRVDRVVVSWHIPQQSSVPTVEVRKGTPASNPVGPALVNDGEYAEICLAEINLAAGQTEITADNIIDTRLNTELCGLVSAGLDKYPTDGLEAEFRAWFDALKTDLDGDVAANLLSNIETHKADTEVHLRRLEYAKSGTTHQLTGLTAVSGVVSCVFTATAAFAEGDSFTVDGESYTVQLSNGDTPGNDMFASGATISVIVDKKGKKVNFKAGGPKKQVITELIATTQKWIVPSGVRNIKVTVFGAGGGGRYEKAGDGGNMGSGTFDVTPGEEYAVTIGKGGQGNSYTSGGASSFGTLVSASGGATAGGGKGGGAGGAAGGKTNKGQYGGNGGAFGKDGAQGTNTVGMGLDFEGSGSGGSKGVKNNNVSASVLAGGGGSGGYGGNGGRGGNTGSDGRTSSGSTVDGGSGGNAGGGGYGAPGGDGGNGGTGGSDEWSVGGDGGHGGGGGYGAPGGDGGNGGTGGTRYLYEGGKGGNGGGGGYGPNGAGGKGGDGGDGYGVDGEKGGDGGIAAGGGGGGYGGGYRDEDTGIGTLGDTGAGGSGGNGICIIQYIGYR